MTIKPTGNIFNCTILNFSRIPNDSTTDRKHKIVIFCISIESQMTIKPKETYLIVHTCTILSL